MPDGLVNLLSDRQQFLDLAKYLIEIAEGGPNARRSCGRPKPRSSLPEYEKDIDHAGLIRALDDKAFRRGEAIYTRVCANCHGTKDQPGSLPTSPRFAAHTFKNGSDPYSLYQTLTRGYGMMAPQTWMVPRQKYDVIHYLREAYLKPHNPTQYTKADDAYLAKLRRRGRRSARPPSNVEPWVTMDYGPSLMNTYEVGGPGPNIAYKGIAVRLDAGAGRRVAREAAGHCSITTRCGSPRRGPATGSSTGRAFTSTASTRFTRNSSASVHVANPVGPGWADPETGSFDDPRFLGRDRRPYGPLPRKWAQFKGTYASATRRSSRTPSAMRRCSNRSARRRTRNKPEWSSSRARWRSGSRPATCSPAIAPDRRCRRRRR